jgi:signal transduction histidine kinase
LARRSIGAPLTIGIVLMVLVLLLAVGWQVLVWSGLRPVASGLTRLQWVLLVLGTVFFVLVLIGLVLLCAWLVREMRSNQRQRAFLDAVTHELKTPLTSFRLYLDTLVRHEPDPERRRDFIDRMRDDLDRLDQTVEQVVAAARAEERGPRPIRERVDLVAVLRQCMIEVCDRHGLSEGAMRLEAEQTPVVRGDPAELGLVFRNLLENAVKYSEEPVEVRVLVQPTGDGKVRVEIADRGIGIPPAELRKIFRRFYRAGRDVQRRVSGLGLGLFVVRSLVRRQGGRVVARSEGLGRGSRFVVTLRAAPAV